MRARLPTAVLSAGLAMTTLVGCTEGAPPVPPEPTDPPNATDYQLGRIDDLCARTGEGRGFNRQAGQPFTVPREEYGPGPGSEPNTALFVGRSVVTQGRVDLRFSPLPTEIREVFTGAVSPFAGCALGNTSSGASGCM
jgi:hypothetical protein